MTDALDTKALEAAYRDRLEADIITCVAALTGLGQREAMDAYYHSRLAREIDNDDYGIRYLGPEVLAADLLANEADLFASRPVSRLDGMLRYAEPAKSLAEMNQGIAEGAAQTMR
ncbi:MAG: hypothetical protein LBK95_06625 [Bifidobacteriaceae bacterium]|nr:hypothetical protein [Bifidobacteriaceae bacterium]